MKISVPQTKRVIIVYWKSKQENPFEIYSSLKNFCLSYEAYNYNTLSNYLSKRKVAFDNEQVRIERKPIISKPVSKDVSPVRNIVPVVRKVLLKEANDAENDLDFWMQKPSKERISAVTYLVSQSLKSGQRMDKRKIKKRKLKA